MCTPNADKRTECLQITGAVLGAFAFSLLAAFMVLRISTPTGATSSLADIGAIPALLPPPPSRLGGTCCAGNQSSCCVGENQNRAAAQEAAERESGVRGPGSLAAAKRLRAKLRADLKHAAGEHAGTSAAAFEKLRVARAKTLPNAGWFDDVDVALPLGRELMEPGDGHGQSYRAIVGADTLRALGSHCTIYGAGVNYEITSKSHEHSFPENCWVHTFDCTMSKKLVPYLHQQAAANGRVVFHPWCVGAAGAELHVNYDYHEGQGGAGEKAAPAESTVMPTEQLMTRLKHTEVDLLKFDIEGYEWQLLETLLSPARGAAPLPVTLAFELHTRGANPWCHAPKKCSVPHEVVKPYGRHEVVELFYALYKLGYRVVEKAVNDGDKACCEFVLVHIAGST